MRHESPRLNDAGRATRFTHRNVSEALIDRGLRIGSQGSHLRPKDALARSVMEAWVVSPCSNYDSNSDPVEEVAMLRPVDATMAQLLQLFLSGRRETTRRAYRQDLEDFRRFVDAPTLGIAAYQLFSGGRGAAHALMLAYRAGLIERGLQPATINRRLAALRSLAKLARMIGVADFALEIPGVAHETYRDTRGPGRENVQKMMAAAEGETPAQRRDRAILRLLYDLGSAARRTDFP